MVFKIINLQRISKNKACLVIHVISGMMFSLIFDAKILVL